MTLWLKPMHLPEFYPELKLGAIDTESFRALKLGVIDTESFHELKLVAIDDLFKFVEAKNITNTHTTLYLIPYT